MIVYRCDNCGTDINPADGTGNTHLRKGLIVIEVQASLVKEEQQGQEVAVLPEGDNLHICPQCVFDVIREGVVTQWNSTLRRWEAGS